MLLLLLTGWCVVAVVDRVGQEEQTGVPLDQLPSTRNVSQMITGSSLWPADPGGHWVFSVAR